MPTVDTAARPLDALLGVARLPVAVCDASPEHRCVEHNAAMLELVGEPADGSLVGRTLRELFGEAAYPAITLVFEQALASRQPQQIDEFPMVLPGSPEPRYLQWNLAPLLAANGGVRALVATGVEISELVRAREAVRANEAQLRLALDAVRMGVWSWYVRSDAFVWSEPAAALLGIPPGRQHGSLATLLNVIHPADRQRVQLAVDTALTPRAGAEPMQVEFRVLGPGASIRWLEARGQVQLAADGLPERVIGVAVDVTARRRAEEHQRALADASRRFADAELDEPTLLQALCESAVGVLGDWGQVQLQDESGVPVGPPFVYDPVGLRGRRTARGSGRLSLALPLRVRDRAIGTLSLMRRVGHPPYDDDEVVLAQAMADRAAVVIENARLFRQAQDAVRSRDQSLSVVVHELRTPVTAIKGYAQSLRRAHERGTLDDATLERGTAILVEASDRLTRLTQDLVDVRRISQGELEVSPTEVDLVEIARVAVDQISPSVDGGHELSLDAPATPLVVRADRFRLGQVLANLLDNALKYSPNGGTIRVSVRDEGSGALVSIADRGIGLPPGAAETVFEPFGRASNARSVGVSGMGLGLHVSRAIVERHGGRVWLESGGEGQGTTVSVWLPRGP